MRERPTIVVVTGAAPYLGGPETWKPLRDAAPEFDFFEIDPLVSAGTTHPEDDYEDAIARALRSADAVVAHAGAARIVVETVARVKADLPIVLLSPMLIDRMTPRLHAFRALFSWAPFAALLTSYARAKHRRLCADRDRVMKELRLFAGSAALSDALVAEAQARLSDPRAQRSVERTAAYFQYATKPIDPAIDTMVQRRRVLLGAGLIDRTLGKRMNATVLTSATGALMLEAPEFVAQSLREMLAGGS